MKKLITILTAMLATFMQLFTGPALGFIQLFAVQTTLLNTTGNDLSPEMKTYYDKNLLREAKANLVHRQFGQKRPLPKGSGKTIEFRKFTPLAKALTPLTEGVTPAGNQLDVTALTATVHQHGDYIVMSDLLELTALDPIIVEATNLLGDQAGRTDDTLVRDVLAQGTNVMYAPKINASTGAETAVNSRAGLDATCKLTVDLVKQVAAKLKAHNVPKIDGSYVAIIHPYAAYDLTSDPAWIDMHKYADVTPLFEGEIGKVAGVRFVETSEAKIWRDNTCPAQTGATPAYYAVFGTIFLGRDAYGVTDLEGAGLQTIVKQKGSSGTADALDQRSSVGWKETMTAEILMQPYMVRVEHMSARYSADTAAN